MPNKTLLKYYSIVAIIFFICLAVIVSYKFAGKQEECSEKQEIILRSDINHLKVAHSNTHILLALSFILKDKFSEFFTEEYYSNANYEFDAQNIIAERPMALDSLLFEVQNMNESETIVKQIKYWCEACAILSMGYDRFYAEQYMELLFGIPEIHSLTSSLVIDSIGQGWYSLSSSQMRDLPYKICNYLYKLPDNDRVKFYKALFDEIDKVLQRPEW